MGIQIVHDQVPRGSSRTLCEHPGEVPGEILLGASLSDISEYLTGGHIEATDQSLRAVANIFKLLTFDAPGPHRQGRSCALQGLNTGHLIDRNRFGAALGPLGGEPIGLANVMAFFLKALIVLRRQPAAYAMRFQVGIFLKNARRHAAK